ncbi:MAG: ABC transporter substrate-binding protein [Litorilinea sp.]
MTVKTRWWHTVLALGVAMLVMVGCAGSPAAAPGSTDEGAAPAADTDTGAAPSGDRILRATIGAQIPAPDIWNPYIPGTFILQGMNQNLMEPLFMLNYETGGIDGWLAESFESNEALDEWTVTLRDGTEWSDGTPLTSEDVVFTIQMLKDNAPLLNWSGAMERWVESVEAVDERTIRFVLTESNPRFVMENLAGTTSQAIVPLPKHHWEGQDPVTFRNQFDPETGAPVFSGSYVVERFSSTEFIYSRNDDWWGAKAGHFNLPQPLEIHRTWIPAAETTNQMLVDNQLDIGGATSLSQMQLLQSRNPNLVAYDSEAPFTWRDPCPRMFTVNHTVEPWGNKEMRWALSHALNRQQIVDVIHEGATVPANFIFPDYEGMMPYIEAIEDIVAPIGEYNVERAHELIEANGYTLNDAGVFVDADGATLSIDVVAPPFMDQVGTIVVQQLSDAGIDAVLRILEWGIFREQTGRGQFEGSTDWSGCGSVIEPWFGMNRYHQDWVREVGEPGTEYVDNTNNAGRWTNAEYSALLDEMGSLPIGDPAVNDLMVQAVEIWADELPAIPLIQQPAILLFNETNWTNWPTADNNYIHPPTHWSTFHRVLTEIQAVE